MSYLPVSTARPGLFTPTYSDRGPDPPANRLIVPLVNPSRERKVSQVLSCVKHWREGSGGGQQHGQGMRHQSNQTISNKTRRDGSSRLPRVSVAHPQQLGHLRLVHIQRRHARRVAGRIETSSGGVSAACQLSSECSGAGLWQTRGVWDRGGQPAQPMPAVCHSTTAYGVGSGGVIETAAIERA